MECNQVDTESSKWSFKTYKPFDILHVEGFLKTLIVQT